MTDACPHCGAEAAAVHDVAVMLADNNSARTGLMGWAKVIVGPVRIDGISIRTTEAGDLRIRMPARKDGAGRLHATVMPVGPELLRRMEAAVLGAYCTARTRAGWRAAP